MIDSQLPPSVFQWLGDLPLGPHGVHIELAINTYARGELPGVPPGDSLPEIGSLLSVPVDGVETTLYRYFLVPRGLRALYSNRRLLSVWCVYFEADSHCYMFRFVADQVSTREGAFWVRNLVDTLEPAYLKEDHAALLETPLYGKVREFLVEGKPLRSEKQLYLAEVAAEVDGEIHFLHHSEVADSTPVRLRLPARPGKRIGLAFRIDGVVRTISRTGIQLVRGKGNKGRVVRLELPDEAGSREVRARTDKEGWAQFSNLELTSQRELTFRVGAGRSPGRTETLRGSLVLRWGRPLEQNLDLLVPSLSLVGRRVGAPQQWRKLMIGDLETSWDPDRGVFRCITPGQVLPESLEALTVVEELDPDSEWARDFLAEGKRRAGRKQASLSPFLRYAFRGLGPKALCTRLEERLGEFDREDPGIWTEERAKLIQEGVLALNKRPSKALALLLRRAAEGLGYRLDAEVEPTWRYQAHGRPTKTFKANPDIALPHAEAVLALLQAEAVLPDLEWLLEIAEHQGNHLIEEHPLDGQPPGYVLGSWKDRARMETPVRLGMALDGLARRLGNKRMAQRVERIRNLVWNRFLSHYDSVEIIERFLLLSWFVRMPPGDSPVGDVDRLPGPR